MLGGTLLLLLFFFAQHYTLHLLSPSSLITPFFKITDSRSTLKWRKCWRSSSFQTRECGYIRCERGRKWGDGGSGGAEGEKWSSLHGVRLITELQSITMKRLLYNAKENNRTKTYNNKIECVFVFCHILVNIYLFIIKKSSDPWIKQIFISILKYGKNQNNKTHKLLANFIYAPK